MVRCFDCGLFNLLSVQLGQCLYTKNVYRSKEYMKERSCKHFIEKIEGLTPFEHLKIKGVED